MAPGVGIDVTEPPVFGPSRPFFRTTSQDWTASVRRRMVHFSSSERLLTTVVALLPLPVVLRVVALPLLPAVLRVVAADFLCETDIFMCVCFRYIIVVICLLLVT